MKKIDRKILRYLNEHSYNDNLTDEILIRSLNLTEYEYNISIDQLMDKKYVILIQTDNDIVLKIKKRKITLDGEKILKRDIIYRITNPKFQVATLFVLAILTFCGFDDPFGWRGKIIKEQIQKVSSDSSKKEASHKTNLHKDSSVFRH